MRLRSIVLTCLLCLLAISAALAQNPNLGTWKLDEAKSHIPAGVGKNTTVIISSAGADIKISTDGVNTQGQQVHTEWTGQFDGKPYPLTGDPNATYRAYKTKGDHTLVFANMKGDKTVSNGRITIAKDGKSRTLDMTYFGSKKVKAKYVYEKQ